MGQVQALLLSIFRWSAVAFAMTLFWSIVIGTNLHAQGSGERIGPEGRKVIDNMSREERREFRSLSRQERREFIQNLLGRRSESHTESKSARKSHVEEKQDLMDATAFEQLDGFVPASEISAEVRAMVGKNRRGDRAKAVEIQMARGGIETGLEPNFIANGNCPEIDSETWAIDYSHKRSWPAIHKGIDIPQPRGTPIRAVADGTVVGKFENKRNRKGIEVMLRHTPVQTGLPYWTYSQYTHLLEMSPLPIGSIVKLGEVIGNTSNSGKMGRRIRRDALHFAILYSAQAAWSNDRKYVALKDGYWMDPNAFYRLDPPYDSQSLANLPDEQKAIPVPYMKADGSFMPPDTKRIWPYRCK